MSGQLDPLFKKYICDHIHQYKEILDYLKNNNMVGSKAVHDIYKILDFISKAENIHNRLDDIFRSFVYYREESPEQFKEAVAKYELKEWW